MDNQQLVIFKKPFISENNLPITYNYYTNYNNTAHIYFSFVAFFFFFFGALPLLELTKLPNTSYTVKSSDSTSDQ